MILRYEHENLVEQRTYREALRLEGRVSPVISIVGAGGKTTTALHLAQDFMRDGLPVAVTTSTHMEVWEKPFFLLEESMEKFLHILKEEGQIWFGLPAVKKGAEGRPKMQAVSRTFFQDVCRLNVPLIVEADGARRLPIKAPGEHEPVIWPETTDVLSIYGLDVLGQPIKDVCFRPELVAEILGKSQSDILKSEDIALLAMDNRGGRKGVGDNRSYWVILNKADEKAQIETALKICHMIGKEKKSLNILVTSNEKPEI